ncbi:protein of unknown function [Nitrospira defluvii]|uniref:Uncharacterized protein n=1 Tax=Nitrospira defluvii TaxID=330214 RepID=D8P9M7_9BACT|nr:protein of unknown function [Nitrospira defluvii]
MRWEVARGWRLGRRKSIRLSETQDPVEKTGYQDVRRGIVYPRKLVCLVFESNPSLFRWLLSGYRIVPRGTSQ